MIDEGQTRFFQRIKQSGWIAGLLVGGLVFTTGCYSGRIGSVRLLDNAVLVTDYAYPQLAIITDGQVARLRGDAFTPMTHSSRWIVAEEFEPKAHFPKIHPTLADSSRLLSTVKDRKLTACDLETGQMLPVPNPHDSDDTQITDLRLDGDRLVAKVTTRYANGWKPMEGNYFAYVLPNGPWQQLTEAQGRAVLPRSGWERKFEDLRTHRRAGTNTTAANAKNTDANQDSAETISPPGSRPRPNSNAWTDVKTYTDFQAHGLNHGDWGELFERQVKDVWEVVFKTPQGNELIVFKQNDSGFTESNRTFLKVAAPRP